MSSHGATVEAPRAHAPAGAGPVTEACPLCGAPLAPDQDWCLRCGAAARTRLAASPNWRAPLVTAAVVIALSLGVLAAALVKLAGDESPRAATTTITTAAATPSTPAAAATSPTAATTAPAAPVKGTGGAGGTGGTAAAKQKGTARGRQTRTATSPLQAIRPTRRTRTSTPLGGVTPLIEKRIRELREKSGR